MASGRSGIGLNVSLDAGHGPLSSDTPFRILLLGDFSGRGTQQPVPAPTSSRPIRIDRDNSEDVLRRMHVTIHADLEGQTLVLPIAEMEDFEPDAVYEKLELFQTIRKTRQRLNNPATFAETAKDLVGDKPPAPAPPAPEPSESTPSEPSSDGGLLDDILAQTSSATEPESLTTMPGGADWNAYLRELVAPHLAANIDESQQAKLVDRMDETATQQMRTVLHHPNFQAIEAIWQGVQLLLRRVDSDEKVPLYLLDMTKDELATMVRGDDWKASSLWKLLVDDAVGTPGGQPWALVAGLYTFGPEESEVETLSWLTELSAHSGAPFVAAASDRSLGCESVASTPDSRDWQAELPTDPAWDTLRARPESACVGLVVPRYLARLPYGQECTPTERFVFEEMDESAKHEHYLWGHPGIVAAALLAQTYEMRGWDFSQIVQELSGLPLHIYEEDGERQVKPCAEALLNDRAASAILERGMMPLLSIKDRDAVFLMQLLSLAKPSRPLTGRWHC